MSRGLGDVYKRQVKVIEADLNNGLLSINLEREIPEHQKPRKIKVNTNSKLLSA